MMNYKQPWLLNAWKDVLFILSPPFFCLLLIALFPVEFQQSNQMSVVHWLILVVFIDVAHVYSTLYRTYFNRSNLVKNQTLLIAIPLICYLAGVIIYNLDGLWFWRILAYLAVFHFIRQQYGFMKLYIRQDDPRQWDKWIDTITIYSTTLYPIVFWHLKGDRNFNWFIEEDFIPFQNETLLIAAKILYLMVIAIYLLKEIISVFKKRAINLPKNLLMLGTGLSWYFGIVYFNGDLTFTLLNVVSHGIPYMALVWFFEKKKSDKQTSHTKVYKIAFGRYGVLFFIMAIVLFAYFEEGLWDSMVWNEHQNVFKLFSFLPQVNDKLLLSLIVPLLVVPQATHYVLDGFIWKKKYHF